MEGSKLNVPRGYSNLHRRFLQHFMKKRMLTPEEALDSYCTAYNSEHDGSPKQVDMERAIVIVNKAIKGLKMEIRTVTDEMTEQIYYAFIPTVSTTSGRLFARYTASQLEFFKKLITEILNSEDKTVSSTHCLNLNSSVPGNVSKSDLEKLINKMCHDLWLVQKNGQIRLSPLAIAELESMLKENYKDYITVCTLCNHIVLSGHICEHCSSLYHSFCVRRYIKTLMNRGTSCPACNEKLVDGGDYMEFD